MKLLFFFFKLLSANSDLQCYTKRRFLSIFSRNWYVFEWKYFSFPLKLVEIKKKIERIRKVIGFVCFWFEQFDLLLDQKLLLSLWNVRRIFKNKCIWQSIGCWIECASHSHAQFYIDAYIYINLYENLDSNLCFLRSFVIGCNSLNWIVEFKNMFSWRKKVFFFF